MTIAQNAASSPLFFAERNVQCLKQGLELLGQLTEQDYQRSDSPLFSQGIGAHMRHIIEHYQCFFAELSGGRVDYDARQRNPALESDAHVAGSALRGIITQLEGLCVADGERLLRVRMDCGGDPGPARAFSESCVARELQFLLSHTVHHYAFLGMMLRSFGVTPPEGFGVAPSTLRYLEDTQ